jgi:hypothetical protein
MHLVSLLLGTEFDELLIHLPDDNFKLKAEENEHVWQSILHQINRGELNPIELAKLAIIWL